jgi:hypothetical protein
MVGKNEKRKWKESKKSTFNKYNPYTYSAHTQQQEQQEVLVLSRRRQWLNIHPPRSIWVLSKGSRIVVLASTGMRRCIVIVFGSAIITSWSTAAPSSIPPFVLFVSLSICIFPSFGGKFRCQDSTRMFIDSSTGKGSHEATSMMCQATSQGCYGFDTPSGSGSWESGIGAVDIVVRRQSLGHISGIVE